MGKQISDAPDPIIPTDDLTLQKESNPPNYRLLLMVKRWDPHDAACLLCGVNPKERNISREKQELISVLYQLCRDLADEGGDAPSDYIAMATKAGIELPPELAPRAESAKNKAITIGKELVKKKGEAFLAADFNEDNKELSAVCEEVGIEMSSLQRYYRKALLIKPSKRGPKTANK